MAAGFQIFSKKYQHFNICQRLLLLVVQGCSPRASLNTPALLNSLGIHMDSMEQ